jgi:hypothetical protein
MNFYIENYKFAEKWFDPIINKTIIVKISKRLIHTFIFLKFIYIPAPGEMQTITKLLNAKVTFSLNQAQF